MAQRVASGWPVRWTMLLRAIARLAARRGRPRFDQTEEAWAGPVRARHFVGDLGEGCIALALVFEAVFEHQDDARFAAPRAHQFGAWLEPGHGVGGSRLSAVSAL